MTTQGPQREPSDDSLFHRVRLRVFAVLVATVLAVVGAVSWAALPLWPVIGVAVATIAFAVNGMTSRLDQPVCWTCGADVSKQTAGEYGVMCPECGSLNSHVKPGPDASRKA